jgi:hemoglobin/transferrin/lactoferrin receptor protein
MPAPDKRLHNSFAKVYHPVRQSGFSNESFLRYETEAGGGKTKVSAVACLCSGITIQFSDSEVALMIIYRRAVRRVFACLFFCSFLLLNPGQALLAQSAGSHLLVTDGAGAPIPEAKLTLYSAQGSLLREALTASDGSFRFSDLPAGSYLLTVKVSGFALQQTSLTIDAQPHSALNIRLSPAPIHSAITVTARRGTVEETKSSLMLVISKDENAIYSRPLATLGNLFEGSPGVSVQQSTYGQVSPFLRGLTGYQVLNLIDGVRFNNSTFRSGPNQYLAFIEPSQAQRVEAVLGPTGVQYGSDALGGTINVLTNSQSFSADGSFDFHGEAQAFAASADASGGSLLKLTVGGERLALLWGGSWKRHNDLRAGSGKDSHHVFHRFFGLPAEQIHNLVGFRQQDTGFTQYGWQSKLAVRLTPTQNLTLWYQRSVLEGVRAYKDLWGGLGRLRSDFEPQDLHFFYTRYEKLRLGWLDSLNGTFSVNAQRDGSIRQNLKSTDPITTDDNRVEAYGYATQAATHFGKRQALVFGGELYREHIAASRTETNPVTKAAVQKRALYPNGSRYTLLGLFAQHAVELLEGRLRANMGGRFTRISSATFADRNRAASGAGLGVTDTAQTFEDMTFNAGLTWRVNGWLSLHALAGRGFRAPNLNDLGALGLNDLGYEIPASEAVAANGLVGTSDGETALSSGKKVGGLKAERLFNYELGVVWQQRRFYARAHLFDGELKDPVVRRTLLFAATNIPATLAGVAVQPIPATPEQRAQGVVTLATTFDPRAVKAFVNDGQSRYYGIETLFRYAISPRWSAEGNYTFLTGRELNPNRFIRRLPPQQGVLAVRFQPGGKIPWLELSSDFTGAQQRLSGGDLSDERIGAARRRRDIADFFHGALARPFIDAGTDGVFGTTDDFFRATGETLAQISARVLPLGATIHGVRVTDDNARVPLFLKTSGYSTLHLRGGMELTERVRLNFAAMNLLDKNYRVHGSGVDAPGVNLFVTLRYSF